MDKVRIKTTIDFDTDYLLGKLDDVPRKVQDIKNKYEKQGWQDLELKMYYYYGDTELQLLGTRPETDKEFADRVKKEQDRIKRQEKQKQKELELLKKLKEKYE